MVKKKASFPKLAGGTAEKVASKMKWADSDDEDEVDGIEEQSQQTSKIQRVMKNKERQETSAKWQDDENDDDDDDAPEETSTKVAKTAVLGSQGSVASTIAKKKAEEKQKRKEKQELFEKRRAEEALAKAAAAAAVTSDDDEHGVDEAPSGAEDGSESDKGGFEDDELSESNAGPSEGIQVSRLPQSLLETPDDGPIEIERVKAKPLLQPRVKLDPAAAPLVRIHKRLESDFDIAEPVSKETKRRKVRGERDVKGFKAVPVNEMATMRGRPVSDAARTFKTRAVEARVPRANAILNMSARGSGFLPVFVRGALQ